MGKQIRFYLTREEDIQVVKKLPEYVGTVYAYNIYGELVKHNIPDQYKFE